MYMCAYYVQAASYYGYVSINFDKVEKDFDEFLDLNQDGIIDHKDAKLGLDKLKKILTQNMGPTYAGFGSGFMLGLVRG